MKWASMKMSLTRLRIPLCRLRFLSSDRQAHPGAPAFAARLAGIFVVFICQSL